MVDIIENPNFESKSRDRPGHEVIECYLFLFL